MIPSFGRFARGRLRRVGFLRGLAATALVVALAPACRKARSEVVVYTSQDQVYAEPILQAFGDQTGIAVRTVFDLEAVKTAGLAARLRGERNHPRCDLFWSNEEMHTRALAREGLFRETGGWRALGYRTRRIVVNTKLVPESAEPTTVEELAADRWRGRVAMAYPLFGTTSHHFLALRFAWGRERWLDWHRRMVAGGHRIVDGNSMVVRMVGAGEAAVGLTDSDDVAAGLRQGLPIRALPLNTELPVIQNTIGLVRGGPNPREADRLADHLSRSEVLAQLVAANALEGEDPTEIQGPKLDLDWGEGADNIESVLAELKGIYLRAA